MKSKQKKFVIKQNSVNIKPIYLEDEIMDEIISKTIFKEKDLSELFEKYRKKYPYLSKEVVEGAINEVRELLDS